MPAFGNVALSSTAALLIGNTSPGAPIHTSYYNIGNPNATLVFIQFFDVAAAASVTVGTTAPAFWIAVPAFGGAVDTSPLIGYTFKNGVVVAATTTPTGSGTPTSTCAITIFTK